MLITRCVVECVDATRVCAHLSDGVGDCVDVLVHESCSVGYSLFAGLSTYVWRRQGNFGLATSRVVSATIANEQVNMLTLRNATIQNPAFNQPLVLISTADAATFETIRLAFMDAGEGGACVYSMSAT